MKRIKNKQCFLTEVNLTILKFINIINATIYEIENKSQKEYLNYEFELIMLLNSDHCWLYRYLFVAITIHNFII